MKVILDTNVVLSGLINPRRLLKNDASPRECTGYAQGKDAGSARSSATGATEDDAWRRPVGSRGRGFVLQQPPRGAPGRIVQRWRDGGLDLVISERQLEVIEEVLAYPKIARRLAWGAEEIERFVLLLRLKSEIVTLPGALESAPDAVPQVFEGLRDSADAHLLSALALSGAEVLVSGDHHLLELRGRLPILSPVEFAARL